MKIIFLCFVLIGSGVSLTYAAMPDIEAAIMNKDYAHARQLASEIIKDSNDPAQRVEAQYYYGLAQLRLGQYDDARGAFQAVMDAHPSQDVYDKAARVGLPERV